MDPIVKLILNSLKCPLCNGQVDLYDRASHLKRGLAYNYCCVNNWEHYRLFLISYQPVVRLEYETVIVYEGRYQYVIQQYEDVKTEINLHEVDAENRVIDVKNPIKTFSYNKKLFDFSNSTREKIIHRVKTILVFQ